jgi:hypothetical protein
MTRSVRRLLPFRGFFPCLRYGENLQYLLFNLLVGEPAFGDQWRSVFPGQLANELRNVGDAVRTARIRGRLMDDN